MLASKRVAVTEPVWVELSDLRRTGETFSLLLAEMIEREKGSFDRASEADCQRGRFRRAVPLSFKGLINRKALA